MNTFTNNSMNLSSSELSPSDRHPDVEGSQPQIIHPTNKIETLFDELCDQVSDRSFTDTSVAKPLTDRLDSVKTPELSCKTIPLPLVVVPPVENYDVAELPRSSEPVEQATNIADEQVGQGKNTKRKRARANLPKLVMPVKEESQNPDQDELQISIRSTVFDYKGEIISIRIKDLDSTSSLGRGGFGCVYAVTIERTSRITMAVKHIPCSMVDEVKTMEMVGSGSCPYIVDYYCALIDPVSSELYICMEFMDTSVEKFYGAMHSLDILSFDMVDTLVRRIAHNIFSGLYYLGNKEIIHRDVKPANMLINRDVEIKLCDFGISRTFTEMELACDSIVGTANYLPPILQRTIQDDMWASGISLLEIINGKNPFANGESYGKEMTIYMWQPVVPTIISKDLQELISHLLKKNPQERPCSYIDILNKPAICNVPVTPSDEERAFVCHVLDKK